MKKILNNSRRMLNLPRIELMNTKKTMIHKFQLNDLV